MHKFNKCVIWLRVPTFKSRLRLHLPFNRGSERSNFILQSWSWRPTVLDMFNTHSHTHTLQHLILKLNTHFLVHKALVVFPGFRGLIDLPLTVHSVVQQDKASVTHSQEDQKTSRWVPEPFNPAKNSWRTSFTNNSAAQSSKVCTLSKRGMHVVRDQSNPSLYISETSIRVIKMLWETHWNNGKMINLKILKWVSWM